LIGGQGTAWVFGQFGSDAGISTGYRAVTPKQVREWTASLDDQDPGVATAPGLADKMWQEALDTERQRREREQPSDEQPQL
jgi:hypothetical protein